MNQQQIQNGLKYTLAQINHIYWIGIELEGYWANGHSCIKGDSSVEFENYSNSECNGECRDNCECSSYCECNDCKKCEICDNEINACDCDSCLFCLDCENHYDDCCCTIISSCKKESCNNDNIWKVPKANLLFNIFLLSCGFIIPRIFSFKDFRFCIFVYRFI